jgi:hypothetical protein
MFLERLTKNNSGGWGLYVLFDSGNTKLKAKVNNVLTRLYNNNNRCWRKDGRWPANYTAGHTTNAKSLHIIRQIREAINKLNPDKASGSDEIMNHVLKNILPIIEHHLQSLMQASLDLDHFPKSFKRTIIVVLRKPNKSDYIRAKAYRSMALEYILGKIMESIISEIISYLTETHELLPAQHFGGRPDRSTEDAMMILSESIYKTWKEKKIYIAMFMDIAGTFNNVHHKHLIHNLRQRRMPETISRWVNSFLQGRSIQLQFNGIRSESMITPAGVS